MMREIHSLAELPSFQRVACIINCGTRWVTSLALVSVLKRTNFPLLVIDCESKDDSKWHLRELSARYGLEFYWLEWPLRRHGLTLDVLFGEISAENVLLVDSDVEIRDGHVVETISAALEDDADAYGAGFLHEHTWMGRDHGLPDKIGWYTERMWIPLVLLRTHVVRRALNDGVSFVQKRRYIEFLGRPWISQWMAYRFWLPGIRHLRPRLQYRDREPVPALIEYDTGAMMHEWLTRTGYRFVAVDPNLWGGVRHFHGVSRARIPQPMRALVMRLGLRRERNESRETDTITEVQRQLSNVYGVNLP